MKRQDFEHQIAKTRKTRVKTPDLTNHASRKFKDNTNNKYTSNRNLNELGLGLTNQQYIENSQKCQSKYQSKSVKINTMRARVNTKKN